MPEDKELIKLLRKSQEENTYDAVVFPLSSLPGTVIITEDLSSDWADDPDRNQELLRKTKPKFEANAARLAYEIAQQSATVGRITRVYVEKAYREKLTVVGIGFRWAHETPNNFKYRDCYVSPDGRLLVQDHTEFCGDTQEKGADPTQFLKYYEQFITDPRYAKDECAGKASHITSLVEE
ncbi:hypothetical protein HY948_04595 [Candidatus Gottesmanbacteria bacterium]|nr:hypothetical protein [Candidatus Gottesmanbacteria bacterium]